MEFNAPQLIREFILRGRWRRDNLPCMLVVFPAFLLFVGLGVYGSKVAVGECCGLLGDGQREEFFCAVKVESFGCNDSQMVPGQAKLKYDMPKTRYVGKTELAC